MSDMSIAWDEGESGVIESSAFNLRIDTTANADYEEESVEAGFLQQLDDQFNDQ